MLHQRKKALVNEAPSTHDPEETSSKPFHSSPSRFCRQREYNSPSAAVRSAV
jgi:hypothetical protein